MDFKDINPFIRFPCSNFEIFNTPELYALDCRIFYLLSGQVDVYTENGHYVMKPNSILFIASKHMYKLVSTDEVETIKINFDFNYSRSDMTLPFITHQITDTAVTEDDPSAFLQKNFPPYIFIENGSRYLKDLNKILKEFAIKKISYQEISSAILKKILIQLYRDSISLSEKSQDAVSDIINYINENYSEPITNLMLSTISGYNERHLNRLFVNHTGVSLHKYIVNKRITEAAHLLISTKHSISAISEAVGFTNLTNFSVTFKNHYGMTANSYRKKFTNLF